MFYAYIHNHSIEIKSVTEDYNKTMFPFDFILFFLFIQISIFCKELSLSLSFQIIIQKKNRSTMIVLIYILPFFSLKKETNTN
jgi:hypothetical protein